MMGRRPSEPLRAIGVLCPQALPDERRGRHREPKRRHEHHRLDGESRPHARDGVGGVLGVFEHDRKHRQRRNPQESHDRRGYRNSEDPHDPHPRREDQPPDAPQRRPARIQQVADCRHPRGDRQREGSSRKAHVVSRKRQSAPQVPRREDEDQVQRDVKQYLNPRNHHRAASVANAAHGSGERLDQVDRRQAKGVNRQVGEHQRLRPGFTGRKKRLGGRRGERCAQNRENRPTGERYRQSLPRRHAKLLDLPCAIGSADQRGGGRRQGHRKRKQEEQHVGERAIGQQSSALQPADKRAIEKHVENLHSVEHDGGPSERPHHLRRVFVGRPFRVGGQFQARHANLHLGTWLPEPLGRSARRTRFPNRIEGERFTE
ncbi:MAG: hypothetical protein CNCCGFBP_00566 [Fimbriimonadaceae bacterium]|nr:hypothetical protein [Fimbriimonadaceae bacterium]